MCYSTKKKIADCVRQLMKRKEISKITIGGHHGGNGDEPPEFLLSF